MVYISLLPLDDTLGKHDQKDDKADCLAHAEHFHCRLKERHVKRYSYVNAKRRHHEGELKDRRHRLRVQRVQEPDEIEGQAERENVCQVY